MANEIEYVTPDILRTELEAQDKRFDAKLEAFRAEFQEFRAETDHRFREMDRRFREMLDAIAAAARGVEESMRAQFGALDDKYRDIPARQAAIETRVDELTPRVEHVERTLFAPEPPKRRRRAQRR